MIEIIKKHSRLTLVFLALTASPTVLAAQQVNVNVSPTTGYYETTSSTYRVPPTAKVNPIKDVTIPTVEKIPGGGLSQKISSGIEITAVKQTAPIGATLKMGAQSLKNGALRCLKSFKCNVGMQAASVGLDALLDSVDWVMNEGAVVAKNENAAWQTDNFPAALFGDRYFSADWTSFATDCSASDLNVTVTCSPRGVSYFNASYCRKIHDGYDGYYYVFNGSAGYPPGSTTYSCGYTYVSTGSPEPESWFTSAPIKAEHIDNIPMGNYDPHPSDLPAISSYIDLSDPDVYAEISNIPSLLMPPATKTIYDADGNAVEVQETNIWYDFDIIDNNSKQPAIDIKENKETKTYDSSGNLTGSKKTSSTSSAASSSSSSSSGNLKVPTDCAFMPTVCAFLDWFKTDTQVEVKEFSEEASTFQERDFFGEPVPTFLESLELMNDGIKNSPIAQSLSNINFPTGGTCPTGSTSITIAGKSMPLVFESHCDLWSQIAPVISAAFFALWAIIAVRVFLSA